MFLLLLASAIWAFSFGLLGNTLAGVPPAFVAGARLTLAAAVFLPLLRRVPGRQAVVLLGIGALQFGVMYLCYNASFACLPSHTVALLTVFTPVYVTLLHDAWRRRMAWRALAAALVAVIGAAIVLGSGPDFAASLRGFLLVQASNLCFALGQIAYRDWKPSSGRPADGCAMAWLYLGGMLATLPWAVGTCGAACRALGPRQVLALVYLGLIASGLGFFLWNAGARRTAPGLLAVANNLKIPLAAAVSLLVFGERAAPWRLAAGGGLLLGAAWLGHRADARKCPRDSRA